MLTGEPYPAEKHARDEGVDSPEVAEATNAAFMGSSVMNGSAKLLVCATGLATQLGQISSSLRRAPPPSALDQGTRRFGMLIVRLTEILVRRRATATPDAVRISVTDRGPGIDAEKHAVIFEKFRQIDGSVTRQHSGSGLGLAISKELITLLSGSIGVKSAPGEGATFWVVLPLKIESGAQDVRGKLVLT